MPWRSDTAAERLREGRAEERAGRLSEATGCYEAAIALAEEGSDSAVMAEALRRLAVVSHHRGDSGRAFDLCRRSEDVARRAGDPVLAAEALNTLGGIEILTGALDDARRNFLQALELGSESVELLARLEQNLGILANIQGDLDEAQSRYARSLEAYRGAGDDQGCGLAYHNLGMVSADRELLDQADHYFRESRDIAQRVGDVHLQALCLINHAEVHVARQRYEDARVDGEAALDIFDHLGGDAEKSGAYRVIGMVYREIGKTALAEARLQRAIDLAAATGSVLNQAEATRELALLYQAMGRNQEALRMLNTAHRLFGRLDARRDLVHVDGKVAALEGTFLAVVREWGQSIESKDSYTFGHSERVAQNAVAVAAALGLDQDQRTTIRLAAYLHDVGKVKVPHELLRKQGPLTREEFALVAMHPVWGVELLAGVEFPWDLKPIIRWHHEKYDGTGYPDHLKGDEIPLPAQIVGIADVFDALTTDRPYRPGMSPGQACLEMAGMRSAWSEPVFHAFLQALPKLVHQGNQTAAFGHAA